MIGNILNALVHFRAEATPETFERVFGPIDSPRLWSAYDFNCRRDLVCLYAWLTDNQRLLFEAHLAAQLPPACFEPPRCVECGGELTGTDIEAGEDVCLDCAASIALERGAEAGGVDGDGIAHEPGSLLATVRVRLDEVGGLEAWEERAQRNGWGSEP